MAQSETGAALNIHPGRRTDQPLEVATFVRKLGYSVDRLIVSHIDRTIFDAKSLLTLADTGCVIEFDLFGWETSAYPFNDIDMPNDAMRLKWIRLLIENGHLDRILISHDICSRTRLSRYGGHGYEHIFSNVVPLMRRRGFSTTELDGTLVRNPKRLLARFELDMTQDAVAVQGKVVSAAIDVGSQDLDIPTTISPKRSQQLGNKRVLDDLLAQARFGIKCRIHDLGGANGRGCKRTLTG